MKKFNTEIEILLLGHGITKPIVTYGIDSDILDQVEVNEFLIKLDLNLKKGTHKIFLEFYNKTNDTSDMAIEIAYVKYEGMQLDRFKWASKYYPNYPEPWASQQSESLPLVHHSATYLGWNGLLELEFETPIYTWIHKLENLGWIYP